MLWFEVDHRVNCFKRQLRWAGHVARMSYERMPRKVLSSWVPNERPIGVPEFTYGRSLYKCLKDSGFEMAEAHFSHEEIKSIL